MKHSLPTPTLLTLAWRNLWRHRRRTIITLSSIALGFGLAVWSIGMQDSGHNSMIRNAIKIGEGHITVQAPQYQASPANYKFIKDGQALIDKLEQMNIPGKVSPRIALQILASTASNSVGAGLQGMNVDNDPRADTLKPQITHGKWLETGDTRGLLIGKGMANKLKAKIGSKIVIMSGKKGGDTEAQLGRVRGIFHAKVNDLDNYLILSNLDFAQKFLIAEGANAQDNPITRAAVFLNDADLMDVWDQKIKQTLNTDNTVVLNWREMMPQLVQYIILDDVGAYIMLLLILMVIAFGIINTVLMSVLERTREFGLLRALGLSRFYLLLLVFFESFLLSILAVATGWIVGGSIHLYMATYGIDISTMIPEGTQFAGSFMDPVIRSELSSDRVFQLTTIVFFTTLASGIYPAVKAARITPVAALRT